VTLTTWHPLSAKKLALTLLTSGGRSVGIVRLRTEATEFSSFFLNSYGRDFDRIGTLSQITGLNDVSKVNLTLLIKDHTLKMYLGVCVQIQVFFTLVLVGGEFLLHPRESPWYLLDRRKF
jgi:hypothetical protein